MPMDLLPPEIRDCIAQYLWDDKPARIAMAAVSRIWQTTIENSTFKEIHLSSYDLGLFESVVHNIHRRRKHVRSIYFSVVLPPYEDEERRLFENDEDRTVNNLAFSNAIIGLFDLLQHWEDSSQRAGLLTLVLSDVYSSSDHPFLRHYSPERAPRLLDQVLRQENTSGSMTEYKIVDLYKWRHRYSHIDLLTAQELPSVPVIGSLRKRFHTRNVCDHVPLVLATHMPNLVRASWRLNVWDIKYLDLRRAHRRMFTDGIAGHMASLTNLEVLSISMSTPIPWADIFFDGNLNPANSSGDHDMLSRALHNALTSLPALKSLDLNGCFDSSLFWSVSPHTDESVHNSDGLPQHWKSLERIRVQLDGRRPSGGTYFSLLNRNPPRPGWASSVENESPPGYTTTHQEQAGMFASMPSEVESFHVRHHTFSIPSGDTAVLPDHEGSLSPVLEAFAKACGHLMPKLRQAQLYTTVPSVVPVPRDVNHGDAVLPSMPRGRRPWGVCYYSPGARTDDPQAWPRHSEFYDQSTRRRLFWATSGWRPADDVHQHFVNIGAEQYGPDLCEQDIRFW